MEFGLHACVYLYLCVSVCVLNLVSFHASERILDLGYVHEY